MSNASIGEGGLKGTPDTFPVRVIRTTSFRQRLGFLKGEW